MVFLPHHMATLRNDRDGEYTKRDVTIAAGLAAGLKVKDVAEILGITEKALYDYQARHEHQLRPLREHLASFLKINVREVKAVALDAAKAEFETRLGKAMAALDNAMDASDPRTAFEAAKEVFNRLLGKSTSNVNVNNSGRVEHAHIHQIAAKTALAFDLDAETDMGLHQRARLLTQGDRPVIDVGAS